MCYTEQYEALKDNLEKLYLKSIDDLEAHKLAVEAPTRARVEVRERGFCRGRGRGA